MKQLKHKIICGDTIKVLQKIEKEFIDMVLTSPPYWGLRDYNMEEQIGLEDTLEEYHAKLLAITKECKRVLKPTGVLFWNHGDSYGGSGNASGHTDATTNCGRKTADYGATKEHSVGFKPKCMLMQNERLIIKMVDKQGWILRNRIVWEKKNGMPSSVTDRFSNKYEPVYMLVKNRRYWFDLDVVRMPHKESSLNRNKYKWNSQQRSHSPNESRGTDHREPSKLFNPFGKNRGDVWTIPTHPYPEAHFATFPTSLVEPMIKAACPAEMCKHCGVARERIIKVTENINNVPKEGWKKTYKGKVELTGNPHKRSVSELYKQSLSKQRETIGWTDCTCKNEDKYEPGIVLDPFGGSGTVGVVAEKLGRSSILIDIKPEYCEMAYKRLLKNTRQLKIDRLPLVIEKIGF
jgi:DNA modification methylase